MKKKLLLLALSSMFNQFFSQGLTLSEKQRINARSTGYTIVSAKNPGIDFSIIVIPWDGNGTLEENAQQQINSGWHAQAAIKGKYFSQPFDGDDFSKYSSVVTSEESFQLYKTTGIQWWIICSTLPSFSSNYSNNESWNLNGNQGTNSDVHFLGTKDEKSLILKANNNEGLRILPNGNVRIGADIDPITNTSSLRIYKNFIPSIELANSYGRFEIAKSACNNCVASGAEPGDGVIRNLGQSHNIIFNMPNDNNDGGTYIGIGDDANKVWAKFYNDQTFRLKGRVFVGDEHFSCSDCSGYNLFVKNGIRTEKIKVDIASQNGWADFVFKKRYQLPKLKDVEKYIKKNKHLPGMPTEKEVLENGLDLGKISAKLLQKIEELTLYTIEQEKEIEALQQENKELKIQSEKLKRLEDRLNILENTKE